jgi:hypothetical protein
MDAAIGLVWNRKLGEVMDDVVALYPFHPRVTNVTVTDEKTFL